MESVSYYKGKAFVYCQLGDEHHVTNGHWEDYITLRRCQPRLCVIYDTLRELRVNLFNRGVLV
jgi:hypothetical protein